MNKNKTIILSLGGSLISKDTGIDVTFLKKFKQFISGEIKRGYRFVIVVGGGKTARWYQGAARKVVKLTDEDVDWLGIQATRLNANLLKAVFDGLAHPEIVIDPTKKLNWQKPILIGAGWKPGFSTDFDAVKLAELYKAKVVVNLSNIDYVYDKDPKKFKNARRFEKMSWVEFRKMVGNKWDPGANVPFDPVAAKIASNKGITALIINGQNLPELKKWLKNETFKGTVIS